MSSWLPSFRSSSGETPPPAPDVASSNEDPAAPSSSRLGTFGLNAWVAGRNAALSAAEYMTPVLAQSQFAEKGVLTPDEFVAAGDMLVLRCPTWQWQAGDPAKARPFLPPNKQFNGPNACSLNPRP